MPTRRGKTSRMRRLLAASAMCLAAIGGRPAPIESQASEQSPRNANYTISARLDTQAKTIEGSATILWRNITTRPANDLQFHLYWNAWRDERSTFMREAALEGAGRPGGRPRASIDVTAIRLLSPAPVDLTAASRFIAPDDGNPDDRTVMQVPLPAPVPPGGSISVEVAWTARIPHAAPRTGYIGDSYFIAQWFPKLGVFEDAGWNCHQFHSTTEFFSDYGVYDVSLTVPSQWIVGATGVERERVENSNGTTTHRYYQEDVHDFAWATSPDFVERRAAFTHAALPSVVMRLLLRKEHEGQADRHFAATRVALKSFGEWFGPYPYGHITIVDPAYQSNADGMEYPTLFSAGTRWLIPDEVTINTPEEVVVHEVGHQFWYGLVGTNEFEHAWMDEGLTTYATARALAEAYPSTHLELRYFGGLFPVALGDVHVSRETYWNRLPGYRRAAESDDPSGPSFRFNPATGRYITYGKTALWLNTLERMIGWPALQRALGTFYERWKFRHPTPDDLIAVMNEVSGQDLRWFFDEVHRSSNVFDYGVQRLDSTRADGRFRTSVVVRRHGEAIFPVDLEVTFGSGETVMERWDGRDRWKLFTYERGSEGVSAHVDPTRTLLLDVNYTNNSRTTSPKAAAAATRWSLAWLIWLQDALLTWALFA